MIDNNYYLEWKADETLSASTFVIIRLIFQQTIELLDEEALTFQSGVEISNIFSNAF